MKFLKTKNISKFSINDRTLIAYPKGVGPGDRIVMGSTGALMIPKGTTAQQPDVSSVRQPDGGETDPTKIPNGYIRFNVDTDSFEGYINGVWEVIRGPGSTTITKQTLGPGDYVETTFGPLVEEPAQDDGILVFVENVFQISDTNYTLSRNHLGSGDTYIEFTSPVPLDKYITILFGFTN